MSKPTLKWREGPYNSTRAKAGRIDLGTSWGMTKGDKYVGRCSALGLETRGHESQAAAQVCIEEMVREALTEASSAFF